MPEYKPTLRLSAGPSVGRVALLSLGGGLAILIALGMALLKIELSPTLGALAALGILLIALPHLPELKIGFGPGGMTLETAAKIERKLEHIETEAKGDKASLSGVINRVDLDGEKLWQTIEALKQQIDEIDTRVQGNRTPLSGVLGRTEAIFPLPGDPMAIESGSATAMLQLNVDPNAGRFGGLPSARDRTLSAQVSQIPGTGLARVRLEVRSVSSAPLEGKVTFYLHPTFAPNDIVTVPVSAAGTAHLEVTSYGAFTAGATADGGETRLELDLVDAPGSFEPWRSR